MLNKEDLRDERIRQKKRMYELRSDAVEDAVAHPVDQVLLLVALAHRLRLGVEVLRARNSHSRTRIDVNYSRLVSACAQERARRVSEEKSIRAGS